MKNVIIPFLLAVILIGTSAANSFAQCTGIGSDVTHVISVFNRTAEPQIVLLEILDTRQYDNACAPIPQNTCNNTPILIGPFTVPANTTTLSYVTVNSAAIVGVFSASSCPVNCNNCNSARCATYSGICNTSGSTNSGIACTCDAFEIVTTSLSTVVAGANTTLEIKYL